MNDITYESIESIIEDYSVDGRQVHCLFATTEGEPLAATASIRRDNSPINRVGRTVKNQMMNRARSMASQSIFKMLGGGMVGRTGSLLVRSTMTRDSMMGAEEPSDDEIQNAIVDAFKRVKVNYYYDRENDKWIYGKKSNTSSSPVEHIESVATRPEVRKSLNIRPKESAPQKEQGGFNRLEKEVLARLLVEVGDADGVLEQEEEAMLTKLIPRELGSISSIRSMDSISPMELKSISENAKNQILTAAFCMSYSDLQPHENETAIIQEYGLQMGFLPNQIRQISNRAKIQTLEYLIDDNIQRDYLFEVASQLNLPESEAELALIRYKTNRS